MEVLTNAVDLNRTCRACLKWSQSLIVHSLLEDPLKSMFYECTFVKVKPTEQLPFNLCSLCVALCDAAYNFREMCEQNDRRIRMPDMQIITELKPSSSTPAMSEEEEESWWSKPSPPVSVQTAAASQTNQNLVSVVVPEKTKQPRPVQPKVEAYEEEVMEPDESVILEEDTGEQEPEAEEGEGTETADEQIVTEIFISAEGDQYITEYEPKENEDVDVGEDIRCPNCPHLFNDKAALLDHYAAEHQDETWDCRNCNQVFASPEECRSHVCKRREKEKRTYTCDYCPEVSSQRRQFASHLMTHHPGQAYRCEQCEKSFMNGETWRTHMCKGDAREYRCSYCGCTFGFQSRLTRHMKIHEGQPPGSPKTRYTSRRVPCDMCDATFHSAFYLKQHQLVHTGETPHACTMCSRKFRSKCNLLRHLRTVHRNDQVRFSEL